MEEKKRKHPKGGRYAARDSRGKTIYAPLFHRSQPKQEIAFEETAAGQPQEIAAQPVQTKTGGVAVKTRSATAVIEKPQSPPAAAVQPRPVQPQEVPQQKKTKKKSYRKLWLVLIPAAAAIAAVMTMNMVTDVTTSYTFTEEGRQYYAGSVNHISSGSQLKYQEDGTVNLVQNGAEAMTDLPIYLLDKPEIVISQDMVYYSPRTMEFGQAGHFTHVEYTMDGSIRASLEGKSRDLEPGFLYDGKDLYVFLEPVTVAFNGYTIDLPPMSYVKAVHQGYFMVFDYETKEFFMEMSEGTGVARQLDGAYTIELLGDTMSTPGVERRLLHTRPDMMEPII